MKFFDRIKPTYRLRIWARTPSETTRPVHLGPGDSVTYDSGGVPFVRVKFHGRSGVEVVVLTPALTGTPAVLRAWADFQERESK